MMPTTEDIYNLTRRYFEMRDDEAAHEQVERAKAMLERLWPTTWTQMSPESAALVVSIMIYFARSEMARR